MLLLLLISFTSFVSDGTSLAYLSASILSIIGGQKRFLKLKKEHNYRYFAHIMLFACLGMLRAVFIDLFFHYLKEKTAETRNLICRLLLAGKYVV